MEDPSLQLRRYEEEEARLESKLKDPYLSLEQLDGLERRLRLLREGHIPEVVQELKLSQPPADRFSEEEKDALHVAMTSNRLLSDVLTLPVPLWPQE